MKSLCHLLLLTLSFPAASLGFSFYPTRPTKNVRCARFSQGRVGLHSSNRESNQDGPTSTTTDVVGDPFDGTDDEYLSQSTEGGYTVKQRLREEVDSPFRKVRLLFFGSSAGSALTALYFSASNTIKAMVGGYSDAPPLDESLTSDAINIGAAIVCGFLAFREYKAGQVNLERIARGGKLASLVVDPANASSVTVGLADSRKRLADYRRAYRVLIAAGGKEYISKLARSLNSDQLEDTNIIPQKLQETDVIVVPVLLTSATNNGVSVGDTREFWKTVDPLPEQDRSFDISRADSIIAFPRGSGAWADYLKSEIETASGQGFDVLDKGITLTIKKNGRILRRATGLPPWGDLIGTMEVMDGSQFGMPGDSEKYGGP
jgi:hypothetical protein